MGQQQLVISPRSICQMMLATAIPAHKTLGIILSSSVYVYNGIYECLAPSQINSFVTASPPKLI